jgi:hypothetical protein
LVGPQPYCKRGHKRPLSAFHKPCPICERVYRKARYNPLNNLCKYGKDAVAIRAKFALEQNNRCKICGVPESELNRKLDLDHDHLTYKLRGLLCKKCNSLLGMAKDNPIILQNAIKYLEAFLCLA